MDRELLLSPFRPHEEEVRDVGARDQQDEPDSPQKDPESLTDVTDHVLRERAHPRRQLRLVPHLLREAGGQGIALRDHREHARDIGVGLLDCRVRLQPRNGLVAEVGREDLGAVEVKGQEHERPAVEEAEGCRQHADDLVRFAVDVHRFSDCRRIAAQLPLPVAVRQHHAVGGTGLDVFGREPSPHGGVHPQRREGPLGDEHRLDAFGLARSRHADRGTVPHADVFERPRLVTVEEVVRGTHVEQRDIDTATVGRVPDAHETVGLREGERLEQHTVDHAEDRRVGPDANREG